MKYCTKCGTQLYDEAVICTNCGCATGYNNSQSTHLGAQNSAQNEGLITAAKVLMVVGTVYSSINGFLIPLAWCLPMTLYYFDKIKKGESVSIAFKICTLLFVNTIAGILMLFTKD